MDLHLGNNNYLVNMEHQRRGKTTAGTELSQSTAFSKKTTSWRKSGRKKKNLNLKMREVAICSYVLLMKRRKRKKEQMLQRKKGREESSRNASVRATALWQPPAGHSEHSLSPCPN